MRIQQQVGAPVVVRSQVVGGGGEDPAAGRGPGGGEEPGSGEDPAAAWFVT